MGDTRGSESLKRGIETAKSGNKLLARLHLLQAVESTPRDPNCWLWLAWVAESPASAIHSLERVLDEYPDHELAQIGMRWATQMAEYEIQEYGEAVPAEDSQAQVTPADVVESTDETTGEAVGVTEADLESESETGDDVCDTEARDEVCESEHDHKPTADEDEFAVSDETENSIEAENSAEAEENNEVEVASDRETVCETEDAAEAQDTAEAEADVEADDCETVCETETAEREQTIYADHDDETCWNWTPPEELSECSESETTEFDVTHPDDIESEESAEADDDIQADADNSEELAAEEQESEDPFELTPPRIESVPTTEAPVFQFDDESEDRAESSENEPEDEPALESSAEDFETTWVPGEEASTDDDEPEFVAESNDSTEENSWRETSASTTDAEDTADEPQESFSDSVETEVADVESVFDAIEEETVPQAETADAESALERPAGLPELSDGDFGVSVLVVDDSPTVRKLVSMTLEKNGFTVESAPDGVVALKTIAEVKPRLILLDITMPRLGGYQLCKLIKKHESTKHIPVIMLSGKDGMFDKVRGKFVGCDDYITKPFDPDVLVEKVSTQLTEHYGVAATQS